MNTSSRIVKRLIVTIGVLAISVLVLGAVARAASSDNLFGWAWSNDTGWIKMNNCDSPGSCSGPSFGSNMQQTAPGKITGYAWSSNVGWITFNDVGCPSSVVPGCTGGAYADWPSATPTKVNIKGWARACSVFASGCSGSLKDDSFRGGWDGFIALSKTGGSANWGITMSRSTGALSGYGWGADVMGWVTFDGVKMQQPTCPAGQIMDQFGNCVPITCTPPQVLIGTSCGICPSGTTYNSQTLACDPITCTPPQVLIGNTCGTCPSGTTYNAQTLSCVGQSSCPAGATLDPNTNKCKCPAGQVVNPKLNKCVKPSYNEF